MYYNRCYAANNFKEYSVKYREQITISKVINHSIESKYVVTM